MIDKGRIYSLTSNFPNLQGFKTIPVGFLLMFVVVWANNNTYSSQTGQGSDLTLPLLLIPAMAVFYWFVDQYYKLAYGSVKQTVKKKRQEFFLSSAAALLALGAFILDTREQIPFSLLGLIWAAMLLITGWRTARALPERGFPFFWLLAAVMFVISLLPVFGLAGWWLSVGFRSQLLAVLFVAAILIIVNGVAWHYVLTRGLKIGERIDG